MALAPSVLSDEQLTRLRESFSGAIITPADTPYDEARRLWNAVHDRRPGRHRPAADEYRDRHRHPVRARTRPRPGGPLRRPQPGWPPDLRRRPRDRHVGSPARRDRSTRRRARPGPMAARPPRRARRRGAGARARLPDRRHRPHRRRGAHARRRRGAAAATFGLTIDNLRAVELVTADGRTRPRQRDRGTRAVLGPARGRLELRDRHGLRVRPAALRAGPPSGRARLPGVRRPRGLAGLRGTTPASAPDAVSMIYSHRARRADTVGDDQRPGVGDPIVITSFNHSGVPRTSSATPPACAAARSPSP